MEPQTALPIQVLNPRKLGAWTIPCERIPLGIPQDYKPSMAMLPSGELVMVALFMEKLPDQKLREWTPIWRSSDGGKTWSEREVLQDVIGREQWLTCTSDGTLFITSHFLPHDINNHDGCVHSYLHRSSDAGRTWERTKILLKGDERCSEPMSWVGGGHTSRNVVELSDGTLLLGVSIHGGSSVAYLWHSGDGGRTWNHGDPVCIGDYRDRPYENSDGFFTEDFNYLTQSGKLVHWIRCGPPSPMYPMNDGRAAPETDDGGDRTLICESTDGGRTWQNLRDWGNYGVMYPRILRLRDGRLMATFTQRAIYYPLGLQAIFSYDDGETWDFDSDRIIIEGKTPWGKVSGGGFGNTVQLDDETVVSCSTYMGADDRFHLEVVRWALPEVISGSAKNV